MLNIGSTVAVRRADSFMKDVTTRFALDPAVELFAERAVAAARDRDLYLSFATFQEMMEVYEENRDTWPSLPPLFDTRLNDLGEHNTFCMLGRNADGRVVATQAARIYNWPESNFYKEASSLRMWADRSDVLAADGMTCEITAPTTHQVRGNVVYSGAAWYHPTYRKKQLTAILPRMARALSHARWDSDYAISLQNERIATSGVPERVGFRNVDWEVRLYMKEYGAVRFAFVWIDEPAMLLDLVDFTANFDARIDAEMKAEVGRRRAQ